MAGVHVQYEFESSALPGVGLIVRYARVVEGLNEPYRVELTLQPDDPNADLAQMVGRDCTLQIERGDKIRRVLGLVRHIEEGELAAFAEPKVIFVPALWMLGLRRNTRIFQEKTVVEILEDVLGAGLGPYGRSLQNDLAETYPRREYWRAVPGDGPRLRASPHGRGGHPLRLRS